jgi:hypothetical protein
MLLVWLPVANHCLLERAGWWGDDCCPDSGGQGKAPCSGNACCNLDSPNYKSDSQSLKINAPAFGTVVVSILEDLGIAPSFPTQSISSVSPDLPCGWQFIQRAALPVRAPSVAS